MPAERLGLPAVTDRDHECLARALEMGVDLIAQSFVRGPEDIEELRSAMGDRIVPIVAKVETKPAVEQIDAILEVTDALMVARGDLGVELPMEESRFCRRTCSAPPESRAVPRSWPPRCWNR